MKYVIRGPRDMRQEGIEFCQPRLLEVPRRVIRGVTVYFLLIQQGYRIVGDRAVDFAIIPGFIDPAVPTKLEVGQEVEVYPVPDSIKQEILALIKISGISDPNLHFWPEI